MTSLRSYLNPPIVYAACAFQFDSVGPGKATERATADQVQEIYQDIRAQYDGITYTQLPQFSSPSPFRFFEKPGGYIFTTRDQTRSIELTQRSTNVRTHRPYVGWEEFRSRICAWLTIYSKHVPDVRVSNVSVDYHNHFLVVEGETESLYLRNWSGQAFDTPTRKARYYFSSDWLNSDGSEAGQSLIRFGTPDDAEDHRIAFELRESSIGSRHLTLSESLEVLDQLRERISSRFEAEITDFARSTFGVTTT